MTEAIKITNAIKIFLKSRDCIVEPSKAGGFRFETPFTEFGWAATEDQAWAMCWAYVSTTFKPATEY